VLSFLTPGYLIAAVAAAAGLVAAHFIVRRKPGAMSLPTARFVPDAPVLTTGWARIPTDLATLALRVLCVLLAGIALAGPFLRSTRTGTARVILADRSRAVADGGALSDSVASIRAPGDVVIGYSSRAGEELPAGSAASASLSRTLERGSLSAGLIAATRAASRFRDHADSVELVIVSSFASEEVDAATARVRQEWPGRARLVVMPARARADSARTPLLAGEPTDPLAVALSIARPSTSAEVRIVRGAMAEADSAWASERAGRVVVHWPVSAAPAGFVARRESAPAGGLLTAGGVMIAPFQRRWQYAPALDSKPSAWWIDGDVAAVEATVGRGCVRSVAVPVSPGGDFVLRPDLHSALHDLVQPCGGATGFDRMTAASLAMLAGTGRLAPASLFAKPRAAASPIARWLLLASLACALLELVVRRRGSNQASGVVLSGSGEPLTRKVA